MPKNLLPERIESRIYVIRGQKVMIDRDLAELYGVKTKNINKAVKRNIQRFPEDFMFQLTREKAVSRFQTGTLKKGQNVKYSPYAFTEQGVAMLSSVLRSERAVLVNIEIMRTFVRLKRVMASNAELARKLEELEKKCDHRFSIILKEIRKFMRPDFEDPKLKIRLAE